MFTGSYQTHEILDEGPVYLSLEIDVRGSQFIALCVSRDAGCLVRYDE